MCLRNKDESGGSSSYLKSKGGSQSQSKANKYADIHVHNDIGKSYPISTNYKRNSAKSNDSEDTLKSPATQLSEK